MIANFYNNTRTLFEEISIRMKDLYTESLPNLYANNFRFYEKTLNFKVLSKEYITVKFTKSKLNFERCKNSYGRLLLDFWIRASSDGGYAIIRLNPKESPFSFKLKKPI